MRSSPSKHECPVAGCTVQIIRSMLMCKPHWSMVPEPMKLAVWREYNNSAGSQAHMAACAAATRAVDLSVAKLREEAA